MHASVIGSYQRSEASCRQINHPVWGGAEEAWITGETIHLVGPGKKVAEKSESRRGGKSGGKKNNGICCSERSGRGRQNWTVDLGNAIRSERKGVYVITGKIRPSLWEDSAYYGSADSNTSRRERHPKYTFRKMNKYINKRVYLLKWGLFMMVLPFKGLTFVMVSLLLDYDLWLSFPLRQF